MKILTGNSNRPLAEAISVKLALPLHIAVLHNAGAALLLFVLVSLLARVRAPEA